MLTLLDALCISIYRFEVQKGQEYWTIRSGKNELKIFGNPLVIEAYSDGEKVTVINGRGTLKFEHLRTKPDS